MLAAGKMNSSFSGLTVTHGPSRPTQIYNVLQVIDNLRTILRARLSYVVPVECSNPLGVRGLGIENPAGLIKSARISCELVQVIQIAGRTYPLMLSLAEATVDLGGNSGERMGGLGERV